MNAYVYAGLALIIVSLVGFMPGEDGFPSACSLIVDATAMETPSALGAGESPRATALIDYLIPGGPTLVQSCNEQQEQSYEVTVGIIARVGMIGMTGEVVIEVEPQRFIYATSGAYVVYDEYYGYHELVGLGAVVGALTSQQDADGLCACEGWEVISQRWYWEGGASYPYVVYDGWGDPSQDYVTVMIDPYYIKYEKVLNLCPDRLREVVVGGISIIVDKSYYEGPPR